MQSNLPHTRLGFTCHTEGTLPLVEAFHVSSIPIRITHPRLYLSLHTLTSLHILHTLHVTVLHQMLQCQFSWPAQMQCLALGHGAPGLQPKVCLLHNPRPLVKRNVRKSWICYFFPRNKQKWVSLLATTPVPRLQPHSLATPMSPSLT